MCGEEKQIKRLSKMYGVVMGLNMLHDITDGYLEQGVI